MICVCSGMPLASVLLTSRLCFGLVEPFGYSFVEPSAVWALIY